jgi:hypothetical protein
MSERGERGRAWGEIAGRSEREGQRMEIRREREGEREKQRKG